MLLARFPDSWIFDIARARQCSSDYRLSGWTGLLPASCQGGTMIVPLDDQFGYWGWPARLIARIEEHGGEIVMTAPGGSGEHLPGITLAEQLGKVPASFNGYLMVDDAFGIAPALHTRLDNRTQEEIDAAFAAMAARRSRQ